MQEKNLKSSHIYINFIFYYFLLKIVVIWGAWVAQWVKPLPSAQVMISESWDRVPHRALSSAESLLPPPSLSACLSIYL